MAAERAGRREEGRERGREGGGERVLKESGLCPILVL
jgi:hypothetical protein